jgi:uncharacterized protein (DUF58 family)
MGTFWILVIVMVAIAAVLNQPALLMPVALLIGAVGLGKAWSVRALRAVRAKRSLTSRSFVNDKVMVKVDVTNTGRLPVVWLRLHDSTPAELSPQRLDQAISLKPLERRQFEYIVQTNKRGFYEIGPLTVQSGDVLGLSAMEGMHVVGTSPLLVYPRIMSLERAGIPSRMPLGGLRQRQPLVEDPSLMRGKRDYAVGDSLRRVDWKASAATGRLQVKMFESSVALEVMIFLDLNGDDYARMTRLDSLELAIVVAASAANEMVKRRQPVGLATNGVLEERFIQAAALPEGIASRASIASAGEGGSDRIRTADVHALLPRKGRAHFMRMLEILAGIRSVQMRPIRTVLEREIGRLAWGTTLVIITGSVDEALFDALFRAKRAGLSPVLTLCGHGVDIDPIRRTAKAFGIAVCRVRAEGDVRQLTFTD